MKRKAKRDVKIADVDLKFFRDIGFGLKEKNLLVKGISEQELEEYLKNLEQMHTKKTYLLSFKDHEAIKLSTDELLKELVRENEALRKALAKIIERLKSLHC